MAAPAKRLEHRCQNQVVDLCEIESRILTSRKKIAQLFEKVTVIESQFHQIKMATQQANRDLCLIGLGFSFRSIEDLDHQSLILRKVFSYLTPKDLGFATLTCKLWNRISHSSELLQEIWENYIRFIDPILFARYFGNPNKKPMISEKRDAWLNRTIAKIDERIVKIKSRDYCLNVAITAEALYFACVPSLGVVFNLM